MSAVVTLAANIEPWQGTVAVAALASVVVYLFRWANSEVREAKDTLAAARQEHLVELGKRDAREAQLKLDCEARIASLFSQHADAIRRDHLDNRAHEDELRKEFTAVVSTMNLQTTKSAEALTDVLDRLHDRLAKPRRQG